MSILSYRSLRPALGSTLLLLLLVSARLAQPSTVYTFSTPPGSTISSLPVSAQAVLTLGADSLTVAVTNLQTDPTSVAQNISGLSFEVQNGLTFVSAGTLTSISGVARTISSGGTYGDVATTSAPNWTLSFSGDTLVLEALGSGQPHYTLVGPPAGDNNYDNANGSIAGNGPHNPFLAGTTAFTINAPGATENSTISGFVFSFTTTTGVNIPGDSPPNDPPVVPEPQSVVLVLTGLVLLGLGIYRKQQT